MPDHATRPDRRRETPEDADGAAEALTEALSEALIERVVRSFYRRIEADAVLGPVFRRRITAWEPHLQQMFRFWSSVLRRTGQYHGSPMARHQGLQVAGLPLGPAHFARWLSLFDATLRDECPPALCDIFSDRAHRIARSLSMGLAEQNRDRTSAPRFGPSEGNPQ